ncbi:carotenoid oxygenase family protein [Streptomyces sp. MMG1533]|nr:carotenoid oxygenase family protein [Streptomyces sp. MMG1533]
MVLKYGLVEEKELGYLDCGDKYGGEAMFVPKPPASSEDDG